MNGQMMNNNDNDGQRQNQISWQQFSNQIRGAENARAEYLEECRSKRRDEEDAKFVDVEVSTPRRQASSSSGGGGGGAIRRRAVVVKFQLAPAVAAAAAAAVVAVPVEETTTSHYEVVQKPKTRAARRAMEEAELEEDPTPTVNPSPKRERRSDYWVERDDKRRGNARIFKMTAQMAAVKVCE
jgi:hypothetical protein